MPDTARSEQDFEVHDPDILAQARLVEKLSPDTVVKDVLEFRQGYQTLYYNFDHALPPQ